MAAYVFLSGLTICEIKTGRIPDSAVFPAALYFLIVAMRFGDKIWWLEAAKKMKLVDFVEQTFGSRELLRQIYVSPERLIRKEKKGGNNE